MSALNFKSDLESERQLGRFKTRVIAGLFLLALAMIWGWGRAPDHINLHYPPDLRSGTTLTVGEIPPSEIYLFAQYILQMINRWDKNGIEDYPRNISMLRYYLTPDFKQTLEEDFAARKRQGELQNRIRAFSPIPGAAYKESDVQVDGDAWVVWLDVNIIENVLGAKVKDVSLSYPIRVVRYNADFSNNPWQLALDGNGRYSPRKIRESIK